MFPADQATQSPRILVVHLGATGDIIHALPVLAALREAFPRATLGWLAEAASADLLEAHKALDELIALPRSWLGATGAVWQLRGRLRQWAAEVAIDLQGTAASASAARFSGAPRRIGFAGEPAGTVSRRLNTELVAASAEHPVDRNLELLLPLGITSPKVRFNVAEDSAARSAAERMIRRVGLENGFALMSFGSGRDSGAWSSSRLAAIACHLVRAWHLPSIVTWSGEQERAAAHAMVVQSEGYAWQTPAIGAMEVAALARRARLAVGLDSAWLRLADAVGTPCVDLAATGSLEQATAACDRVLSVGLSKAA